MTSTLHTGVQRLRRSCRPHRAPCTTARACCKRDSAQVRHATICTTAAHTRKFTAHAITYIVHNDGTFKFYTILSCVHRRCCCMDVCRSGTDLAAPSHTNARQHDPGCSTFAAAILRNTNSFTHLVCKNDDSVIMMCSLYVVDVLHV